MLLKKNRADTKTVENVFKGGKFINSPLFTFKFITNNEQKEPRISFVAPKSIAKGAVVRNSLRRLGYNAARDFIKSFPSNLSGVFLYRKPSESITEVKNEIEKILHKLN